MTQLEYAKSHKATPALEKVAAQEGISKKSLCNLVAAGKVVIPKNKNRILSQPCGIGKSLRTKVNANLGTSPDKSSLKDELKKLNIALKYKTDTVMDLSVGADLGFIRRNLLKNSPVPLGTVPIYEIAVNARRKHGHILDFGAEDAFETLERQAEEGVDFFTIHAGVTMSSLAALRKHKRLMDIVSRGGAILANWISRNKKENPFYQYYDRVLDIAYRHDVTLSLGDGLRPGSIMDATDPAQIAELKILGELAQAARRKNVQVMIEGPGHVPLDQIQKNIVLEKKLCAGAPFYVLGPLVTDVASGYDHITSAIGGALAASFGADFLCYVTPAEHLKLPSVEDVKEGVIASRIAAHAADIVKGVKGAKEWDRQMSLARKARDWKKQIKLSIDPEKALRFRSSSKPSLLDVCTMCGEYCSMKLME